MSKNEWKKWVGIVGRMLLAYALVFAQGAWAAQGQGTKDKAAAPQKAVVQQANEKQPFVATGKKAQTAQGEESDVAEEKPSRDGSHEGVKVHGHWTIEVRDPDGTVVTHREFENSLKQSTGAPLLANLLNSGGALPQDQTFTWVVRLSGGGACAQHPTFDLSGDCLVFTPAGGIPSSTGLFSVLSPQSFNLATSVSNAGFVLSGTVVADTTSQITSVATATVPVQPLNICNQGLGPCPALTQFTSASQTIQVNAGQTIAVTVNLTFS